MAENPMSPTEYRFVKSFIRVFAKLNVWVYRASGGRLWKNAFGRPICLVKMTGALEGWRDYRRLAGRRSQKSRLVLQPRRASRGGGAG